MAPKLPLPGGWKVAVNRGSETTETKRPARSSFNHDSEPARFYGEHAVHPKLPEKRTTKTETCHLEGTGEHRPRFVEEVVDPRTSKVSRARGWGSASAAAGGGSSSFVLRCLSFLSALASIWRIRSRVTLKVTPISTDSCSE